MRRAMMYLRTGLLYAGALGLVAVGGVILSAILLMARPLVLAALLAALLTGLVATCVSPAFRQWLKANIAVPVQYKGLRLAPDVAVHPNHGWARLLGDRATLGADDLTQFVLGPVERVELPVVGCRVRRGEPLFRVWHGDRSVTVQAPMNGVVVKRNAALTRHPGLVNEDPFRRGWAVRMRATNGDEPEKRLLSGAMAQEWFREEVDRLVNVLIHEEAMVSLSDGGTLVNGLHREIDDAAWKRISETFFGTEAKA